MASIEGSQPATEHQSQSLDRATFGTYYLTPKQGDLPDESQCNNMDTKQHGVEVERESKLRQFSKKLKDVKTTANNIIHNSTHITSSSPVVPTTSTLAPPPAEEAEDDRLFYGAPEQKGPDITEVLKNPVSTVHSTLHGASEAKFAETMDNQVVANGAEVRTVRAYDKVLGATSEETYVKAVENLEELKKARQDAFVRWTMDRHVLLVRRVPPQTMPWPEIQDFKVKAKDSKGHVLWADYGRHVGDHVLLWSQFLLFLLMMIYLVMS